MSDLEDTQAPALPQFAPGERVCGNCKLWRPHSVDSRGWVGPCRLQPSRGLFPPSAPVCDVFVAKGTVVVAEEARSQATRTVRSVAPQIRRAGVPAGQPLEEWNMTREELMDIFREASGEMTVPLASKWEGGTVRLIPGKAEAQPKDLPIDTLFHKIVMVRDRLRVLEQKVNAHPKMSDAEKVEMQQYITRIYGSLTSFNVLFRDKDDTFVGAKSDE